MQNLTFFKVIGMLDFGMLDFNEMHNIDKFNKKYGIKLGNLIGIKH